MIRFIGATRRRPDLSLDRFASYWGSVHCDIVLELADPGPIVGYVQSLRLASEPEGLVSDFDGSPELWIRDAAAMAELWAADRFQYAYVVDSPKFIDMPPIAFAVEERLVVGAADLADVIGRIKLMHFLPASAAWERSPAPIAMPGAAPLRLVRATIIPPEGQSADPSGFHGLRWLTAARCCGRADSVQRASAPPGPSRHRPTSASRWASARPSPIPGSPGITRPSRKPALAAPRASGCAARYLADRAQ